MLNPIRNLVNKPDKKAQQGNDQRTEKNIDELRREVADLTDKVKTLSIMTEVLARIALEKRHVTEAELMQLIELEKLAEAERKLAESVCPQCGRQLDKIHKKCIFCG